jgi:hypothetical protein
LSLSPNTRAKNGNSAESASVQPNTRAKNGYSAKIASIQLNNRAINAIPPKLPPSSPIPAAKTAISLNGF